MTKQIEYSKDKASDTVLQLNKFYIKILKKSDLPVTQISQWEANNAIAC